MISAWGSDSAKWQDLHSFPLTSAIASTTLGRDLADHAALRPPRVSAWSPACAMSVTSEDQPHNAGVVRSLGEREERTEAQ